MTFLIALAVLSALLVTLSVRASARDERGFAAPPGAPRSSAPASAIDPTRAVGR